MNKFADVVTEEEQERLEWLLRRAMTCSSVAENAILNNEHWKIFFRAIRPAFRLPGNDKMRTTLLDEEYVCAEVICLTAHFMRSYFIISIVHFNVLGCGERSCQ